MRPALILAAALALPLPATAAEPLQGIPDPQAIGDIAGDATKTLSEKARQKVLVRGMLGSEITGPGGGTIGTLDNLVIVPGGQVVAAIVKPEDGEPLALPYQALKVSAAASAGKAAGVSLPVGLEELRGMQSVKDLTAAALGKDG